MRKHPGSLRRALTRQMIILQVLVLLLFGLLAALPIAKVYGTGPNLDEGVISIIAESIGRGASGGLTLSESTRLDRVREAFPNFWFIVEDVNQNSVRIGDIPENATQSVGEITRVSSADITDTGNPETPTAILRTSEGEAGKVWILTAGGPSANNRRMLEVLANPFFLGLLVIITVVSLLAVPILVSRQLKGVEHLSNQADNVDINQPGVRLASTSLPTEIRPLVNAVNAALERVDEGVERQRKFMANAAHELRTPIAILQARLELPESNFDRKRLLLDVARLSNLADQLLDLQRMEILSPELERLDLVALLADAAADLAPLAITAGTVMTFDAEIEHFHVLGDRGALSRALTNVMQNALVHGGKNGQINVAVTKNGTVLIEDSGPGIPQEQRKTIFEPFHRLSSDGKGAGLGLHLVSEIVGRHHGHIAVGDSAEGGARFEIHLPAMTLV